MWSKVGDGSPEPIKKVVEEVTLWSMTMNRSYKYRPYPSEQDKQELEKHLELCRQIYNHFPEELNAADNILGKGLTEVTPAETATSTDNKHQIQFCNVPASSVIETGNPFHTKAYPRYGSR
ncbi:IS605-like HTH domain containing protein [Methanonatronarchaeum thermophilum]|uniref:IS605-like HTH domain containing protein n=2 Tax=Methanonatronarchaeum thermophilum TaxID=1927129 RepID=A0A1Y3GDC1_9EURY|nr:IS605-like HTH domain containing protein [Methanonatronarchaeum thermophilum]